jgi:hypothetical protein
LLRRTFQLTSAAPDADGGGHDDFANAGACIVDVEYLALSQWAI